MPGNLRKQERLFEHSLSSAGHSADASGCPGLNVSRDDGCPHVFSHIDIQFEQCHFYDGYLEEAPTVRQRLGTHGCGQSVCGDFGRGFDTLDPNHTSQSGYDFV